MSDKEIEEYLDEIDDWFKECVLFNVSRYSTRWVMWSHDFNSDLRKQIQQSKEEDALSYKRVFHYWINRAKLLQLLYEKKKGSIIKRIQNKLTNLEKKLEEEGRILRHEKKTN